MLNIKNGHDMKLVDMTKEQLVNIILRKDDVEIRLKQEIVSLKHENERLDNEYNRLKRRRIIIICLILAITCVVSVFFLACTTSQKTDEENQQVRWPDFLRDWAADYEINDSQRLSLINLIDSVYYFLEDSTQSVEAHSDQVCRMLDRMAEVIANDSAFEFTLMMRATADNFWAQAPRDERILQCDCSSESISRLMDWQTVYSTDVELMCYTITSDPWQTPWHFANMILTIDKDGEDPLASFVITNFQDYKMDSVQIAFHDSTSTLVDVLYEDEVFVDSSSAAGGVKTLLMPYKYLIRMLSHSASVSVAYKTTEGWYSMRGFPQRNFKKNLNDCPRLKKTSDQITR